MKLRIFLALLTLAAQMWGLSAKAEEIKLKTEQKVQVELNKPVKSLKGSLFVTDSESAQIIVTKQQEADVNDLEKLWKGTINTNPLIKFTLQKLAIPEEQRRVHSSLMAKSMSAIISGASMLPSFMGMNYGVQSMSFASARLAHNLINKDNNKILQNSPLTDTEAIELAGLIEDLQDEIIVTYYCYKNSLVRLKDLRAEMLLLNKNYADALAKADNLEITISGAKWDEKQIEEYKLKQEAKSYYIMLQRLAGKNTVDNLNIVLLDLKTQNVDLNDVDFSRKMIKINQEK